MSSRFINRRAYSRFLLVQGACLLLAGCVAGDPLVTAKVTLGAQYAHVIQLPEQFEASWQQSSHEPWFRYDKDRYFFKKPLDPQDDFLVKGVAHAEPEVPSDNAFAIRLHGEPSARRATRLEWLSGSEVPEFNPSWRYGPDQRVQEEIWKACDKALRSVADQTYTYNGKTYRFRGQHFQYSPSMLSARGEWLAIRSYNGNKDNAFVDPGNRPYFIEIYDTKSGGLIAAVEGTFFSWDSLGALSDSGWVAERYFVVPASNSMDRFLLFEFGEREKKAATK